MGESGTKQVIGLLRADGGPSGYGATHVFTVRNGKIVHFREYTDLDAPLA